MSYQNLRVVDLKELLRARRLGVSGRKQELIDRLIIHDRISSDTIVGSSKNSISATTTSSTSTAKSTTTTSTSSAKSTTSSAKSTTSSAKTTAASSTTSTAKSTTSTAVASTKSTELPELSRLLMRRGTTHNTDSALLKWLAIFLKIKTKNNSELMARVFNAYIGNHSGKNAITITQDNILYNIQKILFYYNHKFSMYIPSNSVEDKLFDSITHILQQRIAELQIDQEEQPIIPITSAADKNTTTTTPATITTTISTTTGTTTTTPATITPTTTGTTTITPTISGAAFNRAKQAYQTYDRLYARQDDIMNMYHASKINTLSSQLKQDINNDTFEKLKLAIDCENIEIVKNLSFLATTILVEQCINEDCDIDILCELLLGMLDVKMEEYETLLRLSYDNGYTHIFSYLKHYAKINNIPIHQDLNNAIENHIAHQIITL